MLSEFFEGLVASFLRLARWLVGPETGVRSQRNNKQFHKRDRRGPFIGRRSRRQNIKAIVASWQRETARPPSSLDPTLPLPYRPTAGILTKGERAFSIPLIHAAEGKYRIFCKVRLADVICCPSTRNDERRWFRKIGRYHVDFVVCEPTTTRPLLVIELDDRSHRTGERARRERDQWKDQVLAAAHMPVYRVHAQEAYDVLELARVIDRLIRN